MFFRYFDAISGCMRYEKSLSAKFFYLAVRFLLSSTESRYCASALVEQAGEAIIVL